jgi:hypothetical protein
MTYSEDQSIYSPNNANFNKYLECLHTYILYHGLTAVDTVPEGVII